MTAERKQSQDSSLKRFILHLDEKGFHPDSLGLCSDVAEMDEGTARNCHSKNQDVHAFERYPWPRMPSCDAIPAQIQNIEASSDSSLVDRHLIVNSEQRRVQFISNSLFEEDPSQIEAMLKCVTALTVGAATDPEDRSTTIALTQDPLLRWALAVQETLSRLYHAEEGIQDTRDKEMVALWSRTRFVQDLVSTKSKTSSPNASTNPEVLIELVQAFVYDTACGRLFDNSRLFLSQSYSLSFGKEQCAAMLSISQLTSTVPHSTNHSSLRWPLSSLEWDDVQPQAAAEKIVTIDEECVIHALTVQSNKGLLDALPSVNTILEVLVQNTALLVSICAIYAEDYLCLGLPNPVACKPALT